MFVYSDIAYKCGREGCDNLAKLNKPSRKGVYNRFCSARCSANSISTRKKREDTCNYDLDKNKAKENAALDGGYNFQFMIFNNKKELI